MKTVSPGRFEITIAGEVKEVVVSLGLRAELYKLLTKAQLEIARAEQQIYLDEDMAELIKEKTDKVTRLTAEEAAEDIIAVAQAELEGLYDRALADLQERQEASLGEILDKKITASEGVFVKAISELLSERDKEGKVTKRIAAEEILWSPVYADAQEELTELLHRVTEYITSALKKISGISNMITEATQSGNSDKTQS